QNGGIFPKTYFIVSGNGTSVHVIDNNSNYITWCIWGTYNSIHCSLIIPTVPFIRSKGRSRRIGGIRCSCYFSKSTSVIGLVPLKIQIRESFYGTGVAQGRGHGIEAKRDI